MTTTAAKQVIKKLKMGKKYFFRISSYKVVNGVTVSSDWSAWTKKIK